MKIPETKINKWRKLYQSGDFTAIAEENEGISIYMVSRIFKHGIGKIEHIEAIDMFYNLRKQRLEKLIKPTIDDDLN